MSHNAERVDGLSAIIEAQGWNENTVLGLTLDFINQHLLGPAFLDFCQESAESLEEPVEGLGDSALAAAAVAAASQSDEGSWTFTDGCGTGVGNEFWLEDRSGRTAYVCVDQGEVVALTFHDAEEE